MLVRSAMPSSRKRKLGMNSARASGSSVSALRGRHGSSSYGSTALRQGRVDSSRSRMKLPRGVPADRLIRVLDRLGYRVIRQKGSHARPRNEAPPVHMITVPMHNPLKTGTLHGILAEVAQLRSITIESIIELL